MTVSLGVLQNGSCERLKAGVHATAFGLAALMGLYNAAAWLSRRQAHLAVNTVLYAVLTAWEQKHVSHHLAELRRPCPAPPVSAPDEEVVAPVFIPAPEPPGSTETPAAA